MTSRCLSRAFWVLGREACHLCVNEKAPQAWHPLPRPRRHQELAAGGSFLWMLGANLPVIRLPCPSRDRGEEPPRVPAEIMSHPVPFTDTGLACVSWF